MPGPITSGHPACFPGAGKPGTWYSVALANKIAGTDLTEAGRPQINSQFNANLGQANCLPGAGFGYGLKGNEGADIDLVATLLHEVGYGLGFQTFTGRSGSTVTGAYFSGQPSIWDHYLQDISTGKFWADPAMTDAERAASAVIPGNLAWTGANAVAAAPSVLTGTPELRILGRNSGDAKSAYAVGTASSGPVIGKPAVFGQLMPVIDQADGVTGLACEPLTGANLTAVAGNIALIDRGVCGFTIKVTNAQDAGAIGVIIADNVAGSPRQGWVGPTPASPSPRCA